MVYTGPMDQNKGFTALTALLVAFIVAVVGFGVYAVMHPEVFQKSVTTTEEGAPVEEGAATAETAATTDWEKSITWHLTDAGEVDAMPRTKVSVTIAGTTYDAGTYTGSCTEIGANGGVDGTGLLAGELSAVQCWFAGGGDEIGIFAHEDGGFDILVGGLSEKEAGQGLFRGDFVVKQSVTI